MPRVLRALFATVSFFTSIAIVIFFYGYKYGAPGQSLPPITTIETFVLSLMSSAMSIPIITVLRGLMTRAGDWEFKVRYPILAAEMERRRLFERLLTRIPVTEIKKQGTRLLSKLNLLAPKISGAPTNASGSDSETSSRGGRAGTVSPPAAGTLVSSRSLDMGTSGQQEVGQNAASVIVALSDSTSAGGMAEEVGNAVEVNMIFTVLAWVGSRIRCCGRKFIQPKAPSLRRIILYVMRNSRIPESHERPCLPYRFIPVHTVKGWLLVSGLLAWLVFMMLYILAFTSFEAEGAAAGVIRAVATSQAVSNGLVAPITIFTSVLIPFLLTKLQLLCCGHRHSEQEPLPVLGAPLTDKLTKLLNVRLPILSSLHPCEAGKATIDIKIQPIAEIVREVLRAPEPPLDVEGRQLVEEIYTEVFHKNGIEKSVKQSKKRGRRGSTSSTSSGSGQGTPIPNSSPVLKPQQMVIEDITDRAYIDL